MHLVTSVHQGCLLTGDGISYASVLSAVLLQPSLLQYNLKEGRPYFMERNEPERNGTTPYNSERTESRAILLRVR